MHGARYRPCAIAGEGSFGQVWRCWDRVLAQHVAIKCFWPDEHDYIKQDALREIETLQNLPLHPNVVQITEILDTNCLWKDDIVLACVMPYCAGGNLRLYGDLYATTDNDEKVRAGVRKLPVRLVRRFARQIYSALAHLHQCGIVHRDLKPENILVDPAENKIVICDFGMVGRLEWNNESGQNVVICDWPCCTLWYRAPELLLNARHVTEAVDLWSAALIVADMLRGAPLFCGQSVYDQLILGFRKLGTPTKSQWPDMRNLPGWRDYMPTIKGSGWSKDDIPTKKGRLFVQRALVCNPAERPSAAMLLKHRYLNPQACRQARNVLARLPADVVAHKFAKETFFTCQSQFSSDGVTGALADQTGK